MTSVGAGSYYLMGEALGEAIYQTPSLTLQQQRSLIAGFSRHLKAQKPAFKRTEFIAQVNAYIELAYQVHETKPDFEETAEA